MKKTLFIACVIGATIALSAVYREGPPRDIKRPDLKIVLRQGESRKMRHCL